MRVVAHHSTYIDWDVVPPDVEVKESDKAAGLVKPAGNGGWLMKVPKTPPNGTFTTVHIKESDIVGMIIFEKCRLSGGRLLNRKQAVEFYLREVALPIYMNLRHITNFEVHDDGPDEAMARELFAPHTKVEHGRRGGKNIEPDELEEHVKAYLEPTTHEDHVTHLKAVFKVKPQPAKAVS